MDRVVLVTAGREGLYALGLAGKAGAKVLGHLAMPGYVRDVAIAGDIAFVAAGKGGIKLISIEDPSAPRLLGAVDLPLHLQAFANSIAVAVSGNRMLVANAMAGCQIYDITDPVKPVFLESVASMEYVYKVKAFAGKGYLCDLNGNVLTVDLASFEQRKPFGSTRPSTLTVSESRIFFGQGNGGVSMVPLPVELPEITRHSRQEISIYVPAPATPGRYSVCLTQGGHSLPLPEILKFQEGQNVTNPKSAD
ncbi:MAG: hypothetical protein R2864_14885 [Syntrophotaleaceae bacterium]